MEILAAVVALEALKKPCQITLFSDSQYLVNAFRQGWLEKWKRNDWYRDVKKKEKAKNVDLWKRLLDAASKHMVYFTWIKGHNEHPYNERCDRLAVFEASKFC